MEDVVGEQRQYGALLAEHAPDQGVDEDEQAELGKVGAQSEPYGPGLGVRRHAPSHSGRPVASAQSSGPPVRTATSRCPLR